MSLYEHTSHPHHAVSIKEHHEQRLEKASWYDRAKEWIALRISSALGTMECAFLFICLAIYGFPPHPTAPQLVSWISQTFIQLTALSVLGLGQQIASRASDFVTQQIYKIVQLILHTDEQLKNHMHAQDKELIEQSKQLVQLRAEIADMRDDLRTLIADRDDALSALLSEVLVSLERKQKKPFLQRIGGFYGK